jgi:hypothetical protein
VTPITEQLLQFIWQHQLLNASQLFTTDNLPIQVVKPGVFNKNQGPDFLHATIQVDGITLVGNIEIHTKASHWVQHKHEQDAHYQQLILHIVWENDVELHRSSKALETVPTLVLQPVVASSLLKKYTTMLHQPSHAWLLCKTPAEGISPLSLQNWLERLAIERLQQKTTHIQQGVERTQQNWEEVLWQQVAKYMGGTVNAAAFEAMAQQLPQRLLAKYTHHPVQVEALLFGQLGLLTTTDDEPIHDAYFLQLQQEYQYLQQLHKLPATLLPVQWLRMRPAGFPTVRAAQLAALLVTSKNLFQACIHYTSIEQVTQHLQVEASPYWQTHYHFKHATSTHSTIISKGQAHTIIINAIVPVLFAYAKYLHQEALQNKLLEWLYLLPAEQNTIIKQWQACGIKPANALQSQALLQLQKHYCLPKKCLQCAVGVALLKRG